MADKRQIAGSVFDLIKPEAEKLVENNLHKLLEIPVLRELFNVSPRLMVALLSLGIGMIPEESKEFPLMRFLMDMAEVLPREIGRILEADDGTVASSSNPAATAVAKAKEKAGKKVAAKADKSVSGFLSQGILSILDKKIAGGGSVTQFIDWFLKLSPEDQKKVEAYVLSLELERVKVFMSIRQKERTGLVRHLPLPPVDEVGVVIIDPSFTAVFADRVVKHLKQKPKHPKRYGLFSRFAYRISGNPIDKFGRRV